MTDLIEVPRGGPRVSSGKDSVQEVETPWEFVRACEARWGPICTDLAATLENRKGPRHIDQKMDSLKADWRDWQFPDGICWLNPPFADIAPWAQKCAMESRRGVKILFLVPASIDSNWWDYSVHGIATVYPIAPRIKFVGSKDVYPKPLALCVYGIGEPGYPGRWRWK